MALIFHQFSYLSDNYGVLIHSDETGETACIDAGQAQAVLEALARTGWTLTELWITHHHWDHVEGLDAVKVQTGCKVRGPDGVAGVDIPLKDGDSFTFAGSQVQVMNTPGHTLDMLNYYLPDDAAVFTGDTLFVMGCGRMFEGKADGFWTSLSRLRDLPGETAMYCAHEYTLGNGKFALSVDPDNAELSGKVARVEALRRDGLPTVPSTMAEECATNPFLRPDDPAIRAELDMADATDAEVFAELRRRKDNF